MTGCVRQIGQLLRGAAVLLGATTREARAQIVPTVDVVFTEVPSVTASLLTLVCILAVGSASAQPASSLNMHMRIDQDGGLPPEDVNHAIDELRRIWTPVGVNVTSGRHADEIPPERAIVSLRIVRAAPPVAGWSVAARPVLAWFGEDGGNRPNLFVSRSSVTVLLSAADYRGRTLHRWPQALFDRMVAQAIGRVAAHELGHYLLGSRTHEKTGLMRAIYSPVDLLGPSLAPFRVPPAQHAALRREIAKLAASFAPQEPSTRSRQ